MSARRLRWAWAGKTQKQACNVSVERGPAPFVVLEDSDQGTRRGRREAGVGSKGHAVT